MFTSSLSAVFCSPGAFAASPPAVGRPSSFAIHQILIMPSVFSRLRYRLMATRRRRWAISHYAGSRIPTPPRSGWLPQSHEAGFRTLLDRRCGLNNGHA
ncbi:hypothetical protein EDB81DRAFT_270856 [Dactylonectria macrodidyma]|uniref:Uncharacterized protein n=1 Tax=Dactylonectria macrodidyma TaxID=307937 RepID=A0A9P9FL91_9HYPO|nr:hypothetical protein EDB81DRAFT_270856 [Dactylonectria macrodidyma]